MTTSTQLAAFEAFKQTAIQALAEAEGKVDYLLAASGLGRASAKDPALMRSLRHLRKYLASKRESLDLIDFLYTSAGEAPP